MSNESGSLNAGSHGHKVVSSREDRGHGQGSSNTLPMHTVEVHTPFGVGTYFIYEVGAL